MHAQDRFWWIFGDSSTENISERVKFNLRVPAKGFSPTLEQLRRCFKTMLLSEMVRIDVEWYEELLKGS